MKKSTIIMSTILSICLLLTLLIILNYDLTDNFEKVYVGVTYCGNSVEDGKALIDKVKDYTNLFVLQSGSLQRDLKNVNEIGDYAISAGLYFLPYFGYYNEEPFSVWLENAKKKWGDHFLGIYYGDEPGGKMLDDYVEFEEPQTGDSIMKTRYGDVVLEKTDGIVIHYGLDEVIHLFIPATNQDSNTSKDVYANFYPNGSIKIGESDISATANKVITLTDYQTYDQLLSRRPLKNIDETADQFIKKNQYTIVYLNNSTSTFTSDYALYWFDYLSGYDTVFAQIGWNLTLNQQISLIRGASTVQNKDWGIIITWKFTVPPYLDSGSELFDQMKTAYECGAKYVILFNYYTEDGNPYGTLKEEHFEALESFWNIVIKDSPVHGAIKADTVFVLPKNYGWGMRWPEDKIWGIFKPDEKAQPIWTLLNSIIEEQGLKADIIYQNEEFPLPQEYQYIYYWDQK